jgi:hypothetical protein
VRHFFLRIKTKEKCQSAKQLLCLCTPPDEQRHASEESTVDYKYDYDRTTPWRTLYRTDQEDGTRLTPQDFDDICNSTDKAILFFFKQRHDVDITYSRGSLDSSNNFKSYLVLGNLTMSQTNCCYASHI